MLLQVFHELYYEETTTVTPNKAQATDVYVR